MAYLEIRESRLSLKRDIEDVFTSGSILSRVYNIYGEDDLRAGTAPTRPFIYILDADVKFELKHLPVIALATDYATEEFQLGSAPFGMCEAEAYVMGRNRGERDDFATAIIKNITKIHIRDFDADDDPLQCTVPLISRGKRVWDAKQFPLTDELRAEGSLLNGMVLSCRFYTETCT
jgi:hypothetical protein